MTAREKFKIGDRVRVANPSVRATRGSRTGTVVAPWPKPPNLVRVRRDSGRTNEDGCLYWDVIR